MGIISLGVIIVSFYVAWNIGANDTANAMGVAIGSRILSFRKAVTLLIIFVFIGALLEGHKVMAPIGTGLVTAPYGFGSPLREFPEVVLISMFCAGAFVTLATIFGLPVSTHQAIIGGLAGSGIALNIFSGVCANVNWIQFIVIVASWIISPLGAAFFAIVLYLICEGIVRRAKSSKRMQLFFELAVLVSGCYIAYVMGANDVGTAMSALFATETWGICSAAVMYKLALFGAAGVAIGALTFSNKVIGTVGEGITKLDLLGAFVAQLGAGIAVHLFTELKLPVSTSQAIVGGVVGAGIIRSLSGVKFGKIRQIALAWLATPTVSLIISFLLTTAFLLAQRQIEGNASRYNSPYQYRETQGLVSLVRDAANLIEKDGERVFAQFRKDRTKWQHDDLYIFILDSEGNMVLHPDPFLEGKNQIELRDINGRLIIKGLIWEAADEDREGWYHYQWPEPGHITPIWKSSFVRRVKAPSGKSYTLGSGLYNMKMEKEFITTVVDSAVALIEKEGRQAFPLIRDKTGPFMFLDTYVFVDSPDGVELVNGAFPNLEGRNIMDYKDSNDEYIVREYIGLAMSKGSGWMDYFWPKPGQTVASKKHAYVKKARYGDEIFIVGSGAYFE